MSYTTATLTSDSSPSTTMMTALEGALTTHAAWDFVEEKVQGSYTFRIWKNLGSENDWGQDFYVWFARQTSIIGTSSIYYGAMEGWNSGTGLVTRHTSNGNSGTSFTADATYHAVPALSGVALSPSNMPFVSTSTVTFTYHIFINANRISLFTNTGTSVDSYVGIFEPLWTDLTTEFPLMHAGYTGSSSTGLGFSRCPFRGTIASRGLPGWGTSAFSFSSGTFTTSTSYYRGYGTLGTTYVGSQNGVMGWRPAAVDVNASTLASYGSGMRGHIYGVLSFSDPGYALGDTLTVDGVTHVRSNYGTWYSVAD